MIMKDYSDITIVIIGNDGTGKTTLVKLLRERGYSAWERSVDNINEYPNSLLNPKEIDKLTLGLFNPDELRNLENKMFRPKTFWFLLDSDIEIIKKRIDNRSEKDHIFETSKSLHYFRKRYLQFAYSLGIPIINNNESLEITYDSIIEFITNTKKYYDIHNFMLHGKSQNDLQQYIHTEYINKTEDFLYPLLSNLFGPINESNSDKIIEPNDIICTNNEITGPTGRICTNNKINSEGNKITGPTGLICTNNKINNNIWLEKLVEGESKQVYIIRDKWDYFKNKVIIFLKPTIYSHSRQSTGEIKGIEKIRASATNFFLEIMWRNGLDHSYYCINNNGVILSELIKDIPMIEVVVKRYCAGTDKHSYYGMVNMSNFCDLRENVSADPKYKGGAYVRFDWRNPNHLINGRNPVESPWYYIYENKVGKEKFFEEFLCKYCKPLGDKCLPEHLAKREIDVDTAKRNVLKLFYSISHYFDMMGLEIQDACFMIDRSGSLFWSEINQDCMRIKSKNNSFDKDIWRTGGSDVKEKILDKWGQFNPLLSQCLIKNTFLSEHCYERYPYHNYLIKELEMIEPDAEYNKIYQELLPITSKRVMVTCDLYNGKPTLVKSGKVMEHHSNEDINKALEFISVFPDILVVDLNGAMGEGNNRKLIKENATKYYTHCGGGLRTIEDIQDVLSASARRIVVSTNISKDFIDRIPKERLIVELSINENNQILTHGRKGFNNNNLLEVLDYLSKLGVEAISVTFHKTEGHLSGIDRIHVSNVYNILSNYKFEKIYIAGGISTIDDIKFIWSLGCIPQLGSALWKKHILVGDIYCAMLSATDESEIPAIIQSNDGKVKGLIYMNKQSIMKTCEDRLLWRYSRRHRRIMLKGESSGNIQKILKMSVDCDSDTLLITVDSSKPFCHTGNTSCFSLQTSIKGNLIDLMNHISHASKDPSGYSNRMIKYPGLALMKTMEEFWEVVTTDYLGSTDEILNHKIRECCDFLAHFLMYLSSHNVNMEDIFNELNARRWNPKLITPSQSSSNNVFVIGITGNKYSKKTDDFAENILGIRILRGSGRDMRISYNIIDPDKIKQYGFLENKSLSFVGVRPKDMPSLLSTGKINAAITYNTVMDNFPEVSQLLTSIPDPDLSLCLIHRVNETVSIDQSNKILVAAEHPIHVEKFLYNRFKLTDKFSLDRIIGSSETFLVNPTSKKYTLCDALVESGKTLHENGLAVWETILPHGNVTIGLYISKD